MDTWSPWLADAIPSRYANRWLIAGRRLPKARSSCLALYLEMSRSSHISKLSALSALVIVLGACAPIPHNEIISPSITGQVHRNGKPVGNAVVYIEHPLDETCSFKSEVSTHSNGNGQFSFQVRKEFRFFVFMDRFSNWQLCIEDGTAGYQGWYEQKLGGPDGKLTLDCNLENTPHVQMDTPSSKIMGVCRSSSE
jgi:hypothetical protein